MNLQLRQAMLADIPGMHRVRMAVQENRLLSTTLGEDAYAQAMEVRGRGWVIEADGAIVAFAVGDAQDGSVWALFVHPGHEGQGHGRRLHDVMVTWLREQGCDRLWLTTEVGTRAERFYAAAGWRRAGLSAPGEVRLELALAGDFHAGC